MRDSAPLIQTNEMKKSGHLVLINARLRLREKLNKSRVKHEKRISFLATVALILLGGGIFAGLKTDEYMFQTKNAGFLPENEMFVEFENKDFGFNAPKDIPVTDLLDLEMQLEAWIGDPLEFSSYQMPGAEMWSVAKDFIVEGEAARYWGHSRERDDINAMAILPFLLEEFPELIVEVDSGELKPVEIRQVLVDGVIFDTKVYEFNSLKYGKIIYMEGLPVG